MRIPRFSLAAKYRILFGCAVALIIGAALYVPWYMLEALVYEQPFGQARRVADDYFRLALANPSPEALESLHGKQTSLLGDARHPQPRFLPVLPETPAAEDAPPVDAAEQFARQALGAFIRHPKQDSLHTRLESSEGTRFVYVHAVRVTASCLQCHEGAGRAKAKYRENQLAGAIAVDLPAGDSQRMLLIYRAGIVAAGALAGVLAILVFYIITHRFILGPIEELRDVAGKVTEGDLAVRSGLKTGDEFEQLAESLNAMLERLRGSQDELRKANTLLDEKLGEMAEVNVSLFEANRVKSEFIANVSHELRTPLTSIIGFAELLRDAATSVDGNGKATRYADNILISGRILLEIINDLLDLAKIEAGKVELRREQVNVSELCTTLLDFMRPLGDKKNLLIALEADADLPTMYTDRGRVRQILFNLLSNAIKFTPEGGGVTLRARREGPDVVRLDVADTGPGIAAEHQQLIFEKFRQIDASATREHYGTGLGLPIAKELAQLLGGTLGVESRVGVGSTFSVRLPVVSPESSPLRPPSLV